MILRVVVVGWCLFTGMGQGYAQELVEVSDDTLVQKDSTINNGAAGEQMRLGQQENAVMYQADKEPGVSVYPNPMTDVLNIVLPINTLEADIAIVNTSGQVVHQQHISAEKPSVIFDPPRGVYVVMITDGDNFYSRKVVRK